MLFLLELYAVLLLLQVELSLLWSSKTPRQLIKLRGQSFGPITQGWQPEPVSM